MAEEPYSDALAAVFKMTPSIPPDLIEKLTHTLKIEENEEVKVHMAIKRGLVIDIDDDSCFRSFINIGDILLTIDDKCVQKADFNLNDVFKEKGAKIIVCTYIRFRTFDSEMPTISDEDRRHGFQYRNAVLYRYQRNYIGIVAQSYGERVHVVETIPRSYGASIFHIGDVLLAVNGQRQTDPDKLLELVVQEMDSRGMVRVTVERAASESARMTVLNLFLTRNPLVPADCADYVDKALAGLRLPEPKPILSGPPASSSTSQVAFHDRIVSESVIPSDITDDKLVRTPARVPPQHQQSSPQQQQYMVLPLPEAPSQPEEGQKQPIRVMTPIKRKQATITVTSAEKKGSKSDSKKENRNWFSRNLKKKPDSKKSGSKGAKQKNGGGCGTSSGESETGCTGP